jgi:hypothetical protein
MALKNGGPYSINDRVVVHESARDLARRIYAALSEIAGVAAQLAVVPQHVALVLDVEPGDVPELELQIRAHPRPNGILFRIQERKEGIGADGLPRVRLLVLAENANPAPVHRIARLSDRLNGEAPRGP